MFGMLAMFRRATSFRKQRVVTKYGDISNWDVSNGGKKSKKVKEMIKIFQLYPDIFPSGYFRFLGARLENHLKKNTTDMERMFRGASSFNQPLHAPWYVVEQSESE